MTFDFSSIPDEGLPSDTSHEYVVIGSARHELRLSQTERSSIRTSLLADPTTRLAMDTLQKQRDACASLVATARAFVGSASADVSREVLGLWQAAKTDCGNVWTSNYEAELTTVEARVVDTECRNGLRAADDAFVNGSDIMVGDMTTMLATLRSLCKAPEQIVALNKLDTKLANTIKRLEKEAGFARPSWTPL